MKHCIPLNWPSDIIYSNNTEQKDISFKYTLEGVELRKIDDKNHILDGEYGVFSTKNWKTFDIIGCYTGELVKNIPGKYIARLYCSKNDNYWGLDAEKVGNETRFINDYRNIAKEPNVVYSKTIVNGKRCIIVITKNDIGVGEEILSDYGKDYWNYWNLM